MRKWLLLATLSSWLIVQPGAMSADSFSQAVDHYKTGKYREALAEFTSLKSQYPNDTSVHYYLALCHYALNHVSDARTEYEWVQTRGRDPKLRAHAARGLQMLSSMRSAGGGSPVAAQVPAAGGTAAAAGTAPAVASGPSKVKKIIEFYADW